MKSNSKPRTKNRATEYKRYKDYTKAKRKCSFLTLNYGDNYEITPEKIGQMIKGKPYCSCWMCNGSDKWNSSSKPIRRVRAEMKLREDLKEYNN